MLAPPPVKGWGEAVHFQSGVPVLGRVCRVLLVQLVQLMQLMQLVDADVGAGVGDVLQLAFSAPPCQLQLQC